MAYDPYSGMKTKKVNPYGSLPPLGVPGVGKTQSGSLYGTIQGGYSPVAPPETVMSVPGLTTPDYQALLTAQMKPYTDAYNVQKGMSVADLNASRRRALAAFGVIPSWNQDFLTSLNAANAAPDINSVIDDEVRQLAAKNTAEGTSTQAMLDKANRQAIDAIKNNLAARGMLQSGELGYQFGEQAQAYKQANADATGKLNDYLAGVAKAYADAEFSRQEKLRTAEDAAQKAVAAQTANIPGVSLTYAGQAPDGSMVYRGADGSLYRVDGQGNRYPYSGRDPGGPDQAAVQAQASAPVASVPSGPGRVYMPGNELVPAKYAGAQTAYPAFVPVAAPVVPNPSPYTGTVGTYGPAAPNSAASALNALKLALGRR